MQSRLYSPFVSKSLFKTLLTSVAALVVLSFSGVTACAQITKDPGVRGINWCTDCVNGSGQFLSNLNSYQQAVTTTGANFFNEVNIVAGGPNIKRVGLGGRFDSNSCNSCHAQPASGGSSLGTGTVRAGNQLFKVYQVMGAQNVMPFFETPDGPTVVARAPFESDLVTPNGHVQQLFTITGRTDAGTCDIQQPDFNTLAAENNLIFRQTTPFFGGGLMEIINDSDILANMSANAIEKASMGISGHPNMNSDDGSITRFGWKAQKRSLLLFSGEAYAIEEGIDNEFFPNKSDETPGCTPPFPDGPPNGNGTQGVPDDRTDWATLPADGYLMPGDPERFAYFGRLLAAPVPSTSVGQYGEGQTKGCPYQGDSGMSCINGQAEFNSIGCALCHTITFTTPPSTIAALGSQKVHIFSDLLVHHMGSCDADNVSQGQAAGDEFRTEPLWGLGQRLFFMHDARTTDLVQAIKDHADGQQQTGCTGVGSYPSSEADMVIQNFINLASVKGIDGSAQQDLINFLRTL